MTPGKDPATYILTEINSFSPTPDCLTARGVEVARTTFFVEFYSILHIKPCVKFPIDKRTLLCGVGRDRLNADNTL